MGCSIGSTSDRQALAALAAAARENCPPVPRPHAGAKAMLLLAAPVVRLVCPLHVLSFLGCGMAEPGCGMAERVGFEPTDRSHGPGILGRPPQGGGMAERVGFEPTDRSHGPGILVRPPQGGGMAERVGFEPTDRSHGPGILGRPPGGLGRRMAERVGFEPTDRSHGPRILGRPPGGLVRSMAERVGFEPTDRSRGQRFSRPPHSTTLAPLLVPRPLGAFRVLLLQSGGEGGIRTHGRVAPTHAFQACTFDHSVTSPLNRKARSTVDAGRTRAIRLSSPPPGRRSIP